MLGLGSEGEAAEPRCSTGSHWSRRSIQMCKLKLLWRKVSPVTLELHSFWTSAHCENFPGFLASFLHSLPFFLPSPSFRVHSHPVMAATLFQFVLHPRSEFSSSRIIALYHPICLNEGNSLPGDKLLPLSSLPLPISPSPILLN